MKKTTYAILIMIGVSIIAAIGITIYYANLIVE